MLLYDVLHVQGKVVGEWHLVEVDHLLALDDLFNPLPLLETVDQLRQADQPLADDDMIEPAGAGHLIWQHRRMNASRNCDLA